MKQLLTTSALGLVLALSPAMAQDQQPGEAQTMEQLPGAEAPGAAEATPGIGEAPGIAETPGLAEAMPGEEQFVEHAEDNHVRVSDLMDSEVMNDQDESLGTISDVLLSDDGRVVAVIVGVGEFLGIGEKDVAISFDHLNLERDGDDWRISSALTREDLEGAPEFQEMAAADFQTDLPGGEIPGVDQPSDLPGALPEGGAAETTEQPPAQ